MTLTLRNSVKYNCGSNSTVKYETTKLVMNIKTIRVDEIYEKMITIQRSCREYFTFWKAITETGFKILKTISNQMVQ